MLWPNAVIVDPLDGSSDLDVNVSVGTIVANEEARTAADLLKNGRNQLVSGYAA